MRFKDHDRNREYEWSEDDLAESRRGAVSPGKVTRTMRLPAPILTRDELMIRPAITGHASVQRKAAAGPDPFDYAAMCGLEEATEIAAAGVAGAGEILPFAEQIQRAFGPHDISGITVATGPEAQAAARALGARAYATGTSIAFAERPDLHTAAHEAAHVVQQRSGVQLEGGLGQEGDRYERHADAVADRVVAGESAVDLLDQMASHAAAGCATGVAQLESLPGPRRPPPKPWEVDLFPVAALITQRDQFRAFLNPNLRGPAPSELKQILLRLNRTLETVPVLPDELERERRAQQEGDLIRDPKVVSTPEITNAQIEEALELVDEWLEESRAEVTWAGQRAKRDLRAASPAPPTPDLRAASPAPPALLKIIREIADAMDKMAQQAAGGKAPETRRAAPTNVQRKARPTATPSKLSARAVQAKPIDPLRGPSPYAQVDVDKIPANGTYDPH